MKYNNKTPDEILMEIEAEIEVDELLLESAEYYPVYADKLKSSARVFLIHILKMIYQPEKQSTSWINSIHDHYITVYNELIDKKDGKVNIIKYRKLAEKFDDIVKSSIEYAAKETNKEESEISLTYGMGLRMYTSKEWLINFIDITLQKKYLREYALSKDSVFINDIKNLPNIEKYSVKKINKEFGEPEIYG